jgi:uncharacterized protein YndB with AHSA1/START domain
MWIAIGGGLAVIAFFAFVATRPAAFRIQRTATINAPPDAVFNNINDSHRWKEWSPWEKLDPNLQREYAGSESGKGAIYRWSGNSNAGEGMMTITDSVPNRRVVVDLRFTRPFKAENTGEFNLEPAGTGTKVTWSMSGTNNFVLKAFSIFKSMDDLVGKDFETGLAALGAVSERR